MTERELLELWNKNRQQIVVSQMAPTFLLIVTVGLITLGLAGGPLFLSLATLGILLLLLFIRMLFFGIKQKLMSFSMKIGALVLIMYIVVKMN